MMRFELGLDRPEPRRAVKGALTIAGAYIVGGFIPLAPFIFESSARSSLPISVAVTLASLVIFGYIKGRFTGAKPFRSAVQTALMGGLAACAAFLIAKFIA
jgi:VIT1/CCC1 family predicted Fe2+/Mn2+ transporter